MGNYFIGKGVQLLTEESENKIRIRKLELLQPEFGHMPCMSGDVFTFLLAEEGEMQGQVNQEKVDLEAGEALFINAGQSYRLVRSENESCSFYIIEVAGEYLAAGDESLKSKYIAPVAEAEAFSYCRFMPSAEEDTDEDILLQALLAAAQTAEGRDMAYELDMKSWLFTAWGSLYKKFVQLAPECKNAVIRERAKLNRMTGYLTEHCNEKMTLAAMAEACQVSTGDFCRFFKKHMEMTPFEYLQKCRIWNSMDAVLEKTASMGNIAVENGFAGASYFSETFRKEMGCSPADYRKWYRGLSEECPVAWTESKEESAQTAKNAKKGKSGKHVPSYLL
ncbi:helix-turn-helix domain-containing protein [Blautia sp. Sow4_E7]|uniref:helix-turn-helix domain-containing protein n=1 Tax=Blautia sp. Sow4_E7 TaxID=3438749 RepID=UPI003F936E81